MWVIGYSHWWSALLPGAQVRPAWHLGVVAAQPFHMLAGCARERRRAILAWFQSLLGSIREPKVRINRSLSFETFKPPPDNLWLVMALAGSKHFVVVIRRVVSTMVDINSLVFKLQKLGAPLDTWTPERWLTSNKFWVNLHWLSTETEFNSFKKPRSSFSLFSWRFGPKGSTNLMRTAFW